MRKFTLPLALAAALTVSGCVTVTTGNPKVDAGITKLQKETQRTCGYLPGIATIIGVLASFGVNAEKPVEYTALALRICTGLGYTVASK